MVSSVRRWGVPDVTNVLKYISLAICAKPTAEREHASDRLGDNQSGRYNVLYHSTSDRGEAWSEVQGS